MKRRCSLCCKTKPIESFARNRALTGGYGYRCKPCHAAVAKQRREANRDRDREIRRASYRRHAARISAENAAARKADPEKWSAKDRANYERRTSTLEGLARWHEYQEKWKRENPDQYAATMREATRKWRAANVEYVEAQNKAWREANPERVKVMQQRAHAKRKAILRGESGIRIESIDRAVIFERDGGVCGICDVAVDPSDWHMDHVVPLARGGEHTHENVQVSHPRCNMRKHARLPEEFAVA